MPSPRARDQGQKSPKGEERAASACEDLACFADFVETLSCLLGSRLRPVSRGGAVQPHSHLVRAGGSQPPACGRVSTAGRVWGSLSWGVGGAGGTSAPVWDVPGEP
ncbi:hypothetical protein lerEdw1_007663 [Lerista edwardsae]|nr:hypothetical protein lerEdw1_007663 [Lerista edwardsae]